MYGKVSETLVGANVGEGFVFSDQFVLFFNFEEGLTQFKFENFD